MEPHVACGQKVGEVAPPTQKLPRGHGTPTPFTQYVPATQLPTHCDTDVDPAALVTAPSVQFKQLEMLVAPVSLEYVLRGQATHCADATRSAYVPAAHLTQAFAATELK